MPSKIYSKAIYENPDELTEILDEAVLQERKKIFYGLVKDLQVSESCCICPDKEESLHTGASTQEELTEIQNKGLWTKEEVDLYMEALRIYGKNWNLIAMHMKTRDQIHIRAHSQKFYIRLQRCQKKGCDPNSKFYVQNCQFYIDVLDTIIDNPTRLKRTPDAPEKVKKAKNKAKRTQDDADDQLPYATFAKNFGYKIFKVKKDPVAFVKKTAQPDTYAVADNWKSFMDSLRSKRNFRFIRKMGEDKIEKLHALKKYRACDEAIMPAQRSYLTAKIAN